MKIEVKPRSQRVGRPCRRRRRRRQWNAGASASGCGSARARRRARRHGPGHGPCRPDRDPGRDRRRTCRRGRGPSRRRRRRSRRRKIPWPFAHGLTLVPISAQLERRRGSKLRQLPLVPETEPTLRTQICGGWRLNCNGKGTSSSVRPWNDSIGLWDRTAKCQLETGGV